ncbi:hypothetical protein [Halorussus halobius]|uniref:hypothetical protein n=1 Tax=Halorussus halobius TaxID=1710537 RepID=UPI00109328A5|nr:hypothetical protein [Halorussus halobius]
MSDHDRDLAERLGDLDVDDRVRVTTTGDAGFEGPASPIEYVPEASLRVEVRPENSDERYEMRADYDDGWSDVTARSADMAGEDTEWRDLGTVERVEVGSEGDADDWEWGVS